MQQSLIDFSEYNLRYAVGNAEVLAKMQTVPARRPFDAQIVEFLNQVSKLLLSDKEAKGYPDVVTLAFWMRKASLEVLKNRFVREDAAVVSLGRGIVFHIAPSNVPVNYAYSLVTGLLCGNKNVVRIPSKDFEQVRIINRAFSEALQIYTEMIPYICLVQYGHDASVNEALTAIADVRVIWGGDNTIAEIRKASLKPRASEITFADRYSLAVIDAEIYLGMEGKQKVANDFYNDTYLTDQNACTAPRVVVWTGRMKEEAKKIFWKELRAFLEGRYELSGVQAVNKLTSGYLLAAVKEGVKKIPSEDNLIVRMSVPELSVDLMDIKDNSGYFFEYDCEDVLEIRDFCDDVRCQTVSYLGDKEIFGPLILSGVAGIDRVVPMGKTMDFDFLWDGYNLFERLTRNVVVQ